jgi:uroporphyrinogen-III synthase
MRFLVTRASGAASAFAEDLRRLGHGAVLAPLFRVRFFPGPALDVTGFAAVLVTSANGLAALARRSASRDVPLFTVGPETAAAAQAAGFADVRCADGDRRDLAALISRAVPAGSRLLHATGMDGRTVPIDGYQVQRAELYEMEAAPHMPEDGARALRDRSLAGAFFFSPRAAEVFRVTVENDGMDGFCAGLDAYCIGAVTANFLRPLKFAHFYIASRPNRAAMLNLLPKL